MVLMLIYLLAEHWTVNLYTKSHARTHKYKLWIVNCCTRISNAKLQNLFAFIFSSLFFFIGCWLVTIIIICAYTCISNALHNIWTNFHFDKIDRNLTKTVMKSNAERNRLQISDWSNLNESDQKCVHFSWHWRSPTYTIRLPPTSKCMMGYLVGKFPTLWANI